MTQKQQALLNELFQQNNQGQLKQVVEGWQQKYCVFYDREFNVLVYYIQQNIYQIKNKLDEENLSEQNINILKNVTDILIQSGLILNKQILFDVSNPQLYKIVKFASQKNINNFSPNKVIKIISILQKLRENISKSFRDSPKSYNLKNYMKIIIDCQFLKSTQKTSRCELLQNLQKQLEMVEVQQNIQPYARNNQNSDQLLDKYLSVRIDENGLIRVEKIVQKFIAILNKINYTEKGIDILDYQYFGSSINGFGHSKSDVDLTLLTNSFVDERKLLSYIDQKIKKYQDEYVIKLITGARIPLIKIKDRGEEFDIDLCINNILGTINTQLLKQYADLHPKISQCGILIKIWAKNKGLINERQFSSYAIILMFLYSMQETIGLPIFEQSQNNLLNVKRSMGKDLQQTCEEFETNVYFECEKSNFSIYQQKTAETFEKETIESILIKFWRFYEMQGEYFKYNKIITILPYPHRQTTRKNCFQIQDPFDARHDPGERIMRTNNGKQKILEITNKFSQAIDLIKIKNYIDLFDKQENLLCQ